MASRPALEWKDDDVMEFTESSFTSAADSAPIATYFWRTAAARPRGVVQLAHGIAEHSKRYGRLAEALSVAGYHIYSSDHRGHGRSVSDVTPLGSFGPGGWQALVDDVAAFGAAVAAEHPGLPLFLVAHSMGSFAAQQVILDHSAQYTGVVLSGTTALDVLAAGLAQNEGPVELSAFNAGFENRTGYEWLSRDEAEVDAYVEDPLSGFDLPDDTVPQLFTFAAQLGDPAVIDRIRKDLPILIVSGTADPLAGGGELVTILAERYRAAGISDVTLQLYPEARHEIFNELNRDEITAFVISWIKAHG